jgi:hypothetical protein
MKNLAVQPRLALLAQPSKAEIVLSKSAVEWAKEINIASKGAGGK